MIQVKTFAFNSFQVNTYLLFDETNEAIIIDPGCDSDQELQEIKEFVLNNNLKPTKIVNTHGHIDHIVGIERVSNAFNIPFSLHKDDLFLLETAPQQAIVFGFGLEQAKKPDNFITEGDSIEFGNSKLSTFHIPGHSPGSIVYYSEESKIVIVGDVLFAGSIGRTDLPGGDYDALISGIRSKLLTLPPETKVFSGHGPSSTIKQEYDTNPFLNEGK